MSFKKLSLVTKLLLAINSVCVFVLVGLGGWVSYSNKKQSTLFLEGKVKAMGSQAAGVAGQYIWNFDTNSLKAMSTELTKEEAFEFANIYDKDSKPMIEETKAKVEKFFTVEIPITYMEKGQVGKLVVGYNHIEIDRQFKQALFEIFAAIIFSQILLWLVIGYVLKSNFKIILESIASLDSVGHQVTTASSEVASYSQELSSAANEQASSLEKTASAIEQMSSMVGRNTDNAKKTAVTSERSQQKSNEGKEVVERMLQSMQEINDSNEAIMKQVNHSNEQMSEIVHVIQEIGNKTKVINEIVFQTKLLSFNASVEAARAGEHGKGFAVVAQEVGSLAQMSGNAAKEISDMLATSIVKVETIVRETKQNVEGIIASGKEKVEGGVLVAQQCNEVLNEIVSDVASVSGMAGEISSASQEQTIGINQINDAINSLDKVTQQNAATSNEAAKAAEELSQQASFLKSTVTQLVDRIKGSKNHSQDEAA